MTKRVFFFSCFFFLLIFEEDLRKRIINSLVSFHSTFFLSFCLSLFLQRKMRLESIWGEIYIYVKNFILVLYLDLILPENKYFMNAWLVVVCAVISINIVHWVNALGCDIGLYWSYQAYMPIIFLLPYIWTENKPIYIRNILKWLRAISVLLLQFSLKFSSFHRK